MKIKEIKDIANELYKSVNIFNLIKKEIFVIESDNRVYKYIVENVRLSKAGDDVNIELEIMPVAHPGLGMKHCDDIIDYESINKKWFYSLAAAKKTAYINQYGRQLNLFDL